MSSGAFSSWRISPRAGRNRGGETVFIIWPSETPKSRWGVGLVTSFLYQISPTGSHIFHCFHFLKEYSKSLGYTKVLLQVEPGNRQVQVLKQAIEKRMERGITNSCLFGILHDIHFFLFAMQFPEGLKGMAIISGAVLVLGSIVGLGVALAKKWMLVVW